MQYSRIKVIMIFKHWQLINIRAKACNMIRRLKNK